VSCFSPIAGDLYAAENTFAGVDVALDLMRLLKRVCANAAPTTPSGRPNAAGAAFVNK
jgi:hypothetical protein